MDERMCVVARLGGMRRYATALAIGLSLAGCATPSSLPASREITGEPGQLPAAMRCSGDPDRMTWFCIAGRSLYGIIANLQADYLKRR